MRILALPVFFLMASAAYASLASIGETGINSLGLKRPNGVDPLTGSGVSIGQIEHERPGKSPFDNASNSISFINPADVFVFDHGPLANFDIKTIVSDFLGHAQTVASVMISTSENFPSVAPGASLYSSAFLLNTDTTYPERSDGILIAAQHIARQDQNNVAAINHSWASTTPFSASGNSQLALGLDWLSRINNVLNVMAMPNKRGMSDPFAYTPFDDFNGVTVAKCMQVDGVYTKVSPDTEFVDAFNQNRTLIDVIAPGVDIDLLGFDEEEPLNLDGNSYAAPHVTGTVALLQEYGKAKPGARFVRGDRHEVMKAVLLNSADKIKDDGTTNYNGSPVPPGGFLGMERTLLDTSNNNWLSSEAMTDDLLPLDDEMGAGHLNAKRAIQQFDSGEYNPNIDPVPLIGWDYDIIDDEGAINKYVFDGELMGDSFVSITVAWDRLVQFEDDNGSPEMFTSGAMFQVVEYPPDAFQRIDLYLMPKGATDFSEAIAQSFSEENNLDHLFFQIPAAGEYEFWITQFDEIGPTTDYAVAWWAAGLPQSIAGDFDQDGDVDGRDFLVWQRNPSIGNLSDWQTNYGMSSLAAVSVPEPSCLIVLFGLAFIRRR